MSQLYKSHPTPGVIVDIGVVKLTHATPSTPKIASCIESKSKGLPIPILSTENSSVIDRPNRS